MEDWQLIQEFAARNSEQAFGDLVKRYLNLVYSIAFRQVRDSQLAEEITQAVFILLARKAGGLKKKIVLAGWLYRTTRFVAARAARAERRRRQREQEAFQMRQISSSSDERWLRVAPILDEAIGQLGATDRDAILLRFFQEEPLRNIGDKLGISEEAARKRVARSLEKLRAIFERRGFTITTTVLAGVLSEHSVEAAPAALSGSAASVAFANVNTAVILPTLARETLNAWRWAKIKLAAGLGIIGIAAVALLINPVKKISQNPNIVLAKNSSAKTTSSSDKLSAPIESQSEASVAEKTNFAFAFQAVDALTGKGISGAKVLAVSARDPQHMEFHTNLVTDLEGRTVVPFSYSNLMMIVGVVADGYQERCVFLGGKESVPSGYILKLPRGSTICGVVQDEFGDPVANANIVVQFYGTGDSDAREFQRERPGIPFDDFAVAQTDSTGRWTFSSAPETNGNFWINVQHPWYPKASFQNDGDERVGIAIGSVPLKLADLYSGSAIMVLKSGLAIHGVVTDEQTNPIPNATVRFGEYSDSGSKTKTAKDGSFALHSLSPGTGHVTVIAGTYAPERLQVEVGTNTPPLVIQLKPGGWLRIRVVDENGNGMPRVDVRLQGWRGNNTLDWNGLTDDDGRVEWISAPRDELNLFAGKQGYFFSRDNLFVADGTEHTIKMRKELVVSGFVNDAETKYPIASFRAIPGSELQSWERHNLSQGTNGLYQVTFDEYRPPFQIRFEADGYEPAVSEPLKPGSPLTYDIELKKLNLDNAIRGTVLLPDGNPAAGVSVALCTSEKGATLGRGKFLRADQSIITQTEANGRFSFPPDRAPRSIAAVTKNGFGFVELNETNRDVLVQLQPWGRIEGVLNLKHHSNAGQQIVIYNSPSPDERGFLNLDVGAFSTQTDARGNFVFEQAPPGNFDLFFVPGIGVPFSHQTPVEIAPGSTARVQIGGSGMTVSGRFVLSDSSIAVNWPVQTRMTTLHTKLPPLSFQKNLPLRKCKNGKAISGGRRTSGRAYARRVVIPWT